MKRSLAVVCVLVAAALVGTGCVQVFRHSPSAAAVGASDFVRVLMVEKDARAAYAMTDASFQQGRTLAVFESRTKGSPGYGAITGVAATAYEPVPSQPAIDIFLTGRGGAVTYYYAVRMSGTQDAGYKPASLTLSNNPFPATDTRKSLP